MGLEPLEGPHARGILRRFAVVGKLLRVSVLGRNAEVVAEVQQLDGYDSARLAFPDSHGIGCGEQLADAFRAGYFYNPGTGRDQNAAFGEMHTSPELKAGVV